ncbi:unnamed protein product [Symbiodinium microadriaticum]|nr:unnamed protein product [Symbiodinium microadriaticum]
MYDGDETGGLAKKLGAAVITGAVVTLLIFGYVVYRQFRIDVPSRHMAVLTHRTGKDLPNDMEVAPDATYKGVQKEVLNEGRYFYNPYSWDWEIVPMVEIPKGKLGVRIRLHGEELPYGHVVAQKKEQKGIVAEVLKPGRYAINALLIDGKTKQPVKPREKDNYIELIELHNPVVIEAGHKGVVTNLSGDMPEDPNVLLVEEDRRGVQEKTLDPGTYYVNPYMVRVNEIDCRSQRFNLAENKDMGFPSKDGFWVSLDGVVEFRIKPESASKVFVTYNEDYNDTDGNERVDEEIVKKIIMPNARSFCRLRGANKTGRDFIGGETRVEFQNNFQTAMQTACEPLGVEIIQALITEIKPPQAIAGPVRDREVAKQKLQQYKQQELQQQQEALLAVEKEKVKQRQALVSADQEVVKLTVKAEEEQEVAVTKANEDLEVAKLRLEAAKDKAEAIVAQKKAEAGVIEFNNEAEAAGWKKAITALGSGDAFARFTILKRLAPSYREIMTNTADSPLMRIFEQFDADKMPKKYIIIGVLGLLGIGLFLLGFHWTINREYVDEGYSLMVRYKGPLIFGSAESAPAGKFAEQDENGTPLQKGVLREMRGPGRHFYCPIWWETEIVPDVVIKSGEVGIVTCKLGTDLGDQKFLVDGKIGETENKGILRKVLHPGRYRINPYAYKVDVVQTTKEKDSHGQIKYGGWVQIPTGYVGVVTMLADNPITGEKKGIQDKVLPPGLYPINKEEKQVDIIEVGFREATIVMDAVRNKDGSLKLDETGEPVLDVNSGGITFPSNDGFDIHMDFTSIWGLMPQQAPNAVAKFGDVRAVENKVVIPQIESICRNHGSQYSSVELLVGDDRQKFQMETSKDFDDVLKAKDITLLYGLVRHIYIPREVRTPIQMSFIADELKLTREQEQKTAQAEAAYEEALKKVDLESEKIRSDTTKQVAETMALGKKQVAETHAGTEKLVAAIEKQTAALEAQATLVLGEADATGLKLVEEARSQKFQLAVEAFGTPTAYNNWIFASELPEDVKLRLFYAGEGTLWTDLGQGGVKMTYPVKQPPKK